MKILIAGSRPWVQRIAGPRVKPLERQGAEISFASRREDLDPERLDVWRPDWVFLVHWSWLVPSDVVARHRIVGFHMSDLPHGRGGSPLQHLILGGHTSTMLSAFRLDEGVDSGPIYMKRPLDLSGRAQEIYERATALAAEMIVEIVTDRPEPEAQGPAPAAWRRRTPDQSRIPEDFDPDRLHDFIRMLDAEGYPHAFIEHGSWRLEFTHAAKSGDDIQARVTWRRP